MPVYREKNGDKKIPGNNKKPGDNKIPGKNKKPEDRKNQVGNKQGIQAKNWNSRTEKNNYIKIEDENLDRDQVGINKNSKNKNVHKKNDNNKNDNKKNDNKNKNKYVNGKRNLNDKSKLNKIDKNQQNCPVINKCGGCQLLHISYEQQLKTKQKQVEGLLSKFARVEPIIGMNNPYHYRNKVHAVFDHDRKGNPISGVYEAGTHRVIPVESCLIEDEKADEIIGTIRGMLKSFKIKTYDEDTEFGLLRHVLIRKGYHSGEIMVVLVLSSPVFPSKNNFTKALLKQHPEITTIVLNVNNKKTSMVLGEKEQVIYGKGFIEDSLCGKIFRISPKSFYQVNTVQTEILYNKAIQLAGLSGKETIVDAYCGIGTIGLIASDHVNKVIGVELNPDAVKDAKTNAIRNNIKNVDFYNKDAGEFMRQMAVQNECVDVVFMDPPRAGSDEVFLNSVCTLAPQKVVYISCNPVTLERDLNYLVKNKYEVKRIIPVDMFPGTEHVESIVLVTKCGLDGKK